MLDRKMLSLCHTYRHNSENPCDEVLLRQNEAETDY